MTDAVPRYVVLTKRVGETPLDCLEAWRATKPELNGIPMAYAGRLDPMAAGKLLILIGDECKVQEQYHGLDKAYTFEVLFGVSSDSSDVLGVITAQETPSISEVKLQSVLTQLVGDFTVPYPIFSSRTVQGKPLHTWAIEGRLSEITIPTKTSTIYTLSLERLQTYDRSVITTKARQKINSLPTVTDSRKALGNDFRRPLVHESWDTFSTQGKAEDKFSVATISCTASSGTYMRTLAQVIGQKLGTTGLAFAITRTKLGVYDHAAQDWKLSYD